MINSIVEKHIDAIKTDLETAVFLSKLVKDNQLILDDVFTSSIVKMCIEYESFTTEAHKFVFPGKPIKYNHPWRYTRELSEKLKIDISREYELAHESWEIYNTIKHLNERMLILRNKICEKENLKNIEEISIFINATLISLLKKFLV